MNIKTITVLYAITIFIALIDLFTGILTKKIEDKNRMIKVLYIFFILFMLERLYDSLAK